MTLTNIPVCQQCLCCLHSHFHRHLIFTGPCSSIILNFEAVLHPSLPSPIPLLLTSFDVCDSPTYLEPPAIRHLRVVSSKMLVYDSPFLPPPH